MESQSPETTQPAEQLPEEFRSPLFRAAPPRVGRPASSTSTSELPSPSTPPSPTPDPEESSTTPAPSSSTSPRDESPASDVRPVPSGSSPSEPSPEHAAGLRGAIERGLGSITSTAHNALTDDVGRAHGLYLATEQELTSVAEGTASVLVRRLGPAVGGGETADIVQIALAVTAYTARQFKAWRASREQRAAIKAAAQQQQTPAA